MLRKIDEQLEREESFCIETTLSTRHYRKLVENAQERGFKVALFFYWLESAELAVRRVAQWVHSGGQRFNYATQNSFECATCSGMKCTGQNNYLM